MLRLFNIFLLLFFSFCVYAQSTRQQTRTIDYIHEIGLFQSEMEKEIFESFSLEKEPDYLSLFFISDPTFTEKTLLHNATLKIESFITKADNKNKKYSSKELKRIYKDIHSEFFSKYIDNPSFGQIFKNGNYNCATASALYALLLDKLSIAYHIRETPNHVYLIASPGSTDVLFETTTPAARFLDINDKAKDQYVEYLYANKLISKEEWQTIDKKKLFEKYFYTDEVIDKRKLGGLLYYNMGIYALENENHEDAYKNFEKAFFLYPSNKIKYFVAITLANVLVSDSKKDNENAYLYYLRFTEIAKQDVAKKLLLEYIESTTQKLLFKNPKPEKYYTLYKKICSSLTDTSLLADIRHSHYYHSAHYYTIKNKFDSSLVYLDSIYAINKEDLHVHELISGTLQEILRSLNNNEKAALDSLELFFKKYSFIDKNGKFGEFYAYCLSKIASQYLEKNKKKEADVYLTKIQEILTTQPDLSKKSESYFSATLLEVYQYHIRQKQYKEAKRALLEINKWYPENEETKSRLKWIEEVIHDQ